MSPTALVLVLVAALCHALWNLSARGSRGGGATFVVLYSALGALLWLPVAAAYSLLVDHPTPTWAWLWAAAVSGVLHTAYGVVLQRGYREGDLSVVYPVARGVGPLLTLVVAVGLLGERPSLAATLGAVVVVGGIAVISAPGRLADPAAARAGMAWGVATGVTIASYTLFDAFAVGRLDLPPLPYYALSLVFTLAPLVPGTWRRRDELRGAWRLDRRPALVVAVLSPLAYVLVLEAMTMAPVALVAAARESSIVLGTALGVVLLGEAGGWRRAVGSVVVLIGIGFVALG